MLRQLYIKNFTLIDELDISLYEGFSVITGETGAGKSIILGAIALLLGQRADSKTIKQGADKCIIEAHFDLSRYAMQEFFDENDIEYDAEDCIIRRELTAAGKSRAFINDTPVALSMLKELGEQLMDVHSQHQNLLLNKQDFQLEVVDIIANDALQLAQYQKSYNGFLQAEKELKEMISTIERNRENHDFMQFQYDELANANLTKGEQEELEQRSETMEHSEDIKSALYTTDNALSSEQVGALESLRVSLSALRNIENVYPEVGELVQRIDSDYIDLKDVSQEICSLLDSIDFDPTELDQVNNRLDHIYELEKKYHVETVEELINKRNELHYQLNAIENSDESLEALKTRKNDLEIRTRKEAEVLTKLRIKAAKTIEDEMQKRLVPLGMPHVRFSIQLTATELGYKGSDRVSFLFSANTSTPLQPVSQVASGGEIARVMLSLKAMISGAVKLPTIIFDEIDTGVSGKTAEMMAQIMKEMGGHGRQVISITHLPQIAALGSVHYKVEKNETAHGTTSRMHQLAPDERVREIAQMLSGSDISEAAIQNAKELLKN
ncbi:DNA repair protein RecN [Prevotella sp. P6B4]|uniref:DNA repair protein RecN n=1 Tax=Prevotella sp. P6B4 TaxID=1410614 RepID=UPI00048E649E|nr:DNA repair protein RecN [Prevotella sp. P6B4]